MSAEVIAFGPSLVDISAKLDAAIYQECHELLGINPGEWRAIENPTQLKQLGSLVVGDAGGIEALADQTLYDTETFPPATGPVMVAGSSTLGMLGALPPAIRARSIMVTALAENNGRMDPLSTFYNRSLRRLNIGHDYNLAVGYNPVGFVLSAQNNSEKTLAMYPGVTQEADYPELHRHRPELVLVDAYELQSGKLAGMLDSMIRSGYFRVGLSLANHVLLEGELRRRLRAYIDSGRIHVLSGNLEEYICLYPELESSFTSFEGFESHPVKQHVPYTLLTRGPLGLSAHWEGTSLHVPAFPIAKEAIVNTSGAGDTAMGAFVGGVLQHEPARHTLQRAAFWATKVLQLPGSMLLADA